MPEKFKEYRSTGYLVGTRGTIVSPSGKILSQWPIESGYVCVSLLLKPTKAKTVHSLVAAVWIGPRPRKQFVNHKDGNKRNNRKSNLEYVTPSENNLHAVECGLLPCGAKHYMASISEKKARRIWKRIEAGMRNYAIAEELNVPASIVRDIRNGRSWKSITGAVVKERVSKKDAVSKISRATQIRVIKRILAGKQTAKEIGDQFGLSRTMVSSVKHRKAWEQAWSSVQ